MKSFLACLLCLCMLIPLLVSCGETPAQEPGSSSAEDSSSPVSEPATEPVSLPETDPFADADPLPEDLVISEAVRLPDGTFVGTIVVPAAADDSERTAAEELRYHIQKVTGADLPVVGRPGEGYGSLIVATPSSLPALSEMFPDDLEWLQDTGDPENGPRWGSDGFAVRTVGKDIYVFGAVSRGTLNGAYDWIEENLGVLWTRANEELGLVYTPQEQVTVSRTDYREKSPFEVRGWISGADSATTLMWSRNKLNFRSQNTTMSVPVGGYIKALLRSSPLYDPEETEYWNTDAEGNRLSPDESVHINFWSDKTADCVAAACVEQLKSGNTVSFVGEEDTVVHPYNVPEDTQPYEYAPGQFVNPEDEDYLSTVFFSFLNKVARKVKEEIPDGKVGTYAYIISIVPPRCEIEDNIYIWLAPIDEDMCNNITSQLAKEKPMSDGREAVSRYCDYVPGWSGKCTHIEVYNYYGCSRASNLVTRPLWERMQKDFQDYVEFRFEGVSSEGTGDYPAAPSDPAWGENDPEFPNHSWDMNQMLYWLYSKLAWNPYEDVDALIVEYCDKVYGDASAAMQEYYRLMKQGWDEGRVTCKEAIHHYTHYLRYYILFVKKTGIGHPVIDALNEAYEAASGPIRDVIGYMRQTVVKTMSSFANY